MPHKEKSVANIEAKDQILVAAENSSQAVKELFAFLKTFKPRLSQASFCRQTGISSTGNLTDILAGRRVLHPKYVEAVAKAFSLTPQQQDVLKALVARDRSTDSDDELERQVRRMKRSLKTVKKKFETDVKDFAQALEIFCAFGFFNDRPTLGQLESLYPKDAVESAVTILTDLGVIQEKQDVFTVTKQRLRFGKDGIDQLDFIKDCFRKGLEVIDDKFAQSSNSFIESIMISTDRASFHKALQSTRSFVADLHDDLDSGKEADLIAMVNVMMIESRSKPTKGGSS